MPKNKIGDLRNLMFETIERLMDDDDEGMDVEKAQAIANVGKVIVDSAKVEVMFMKQIGAGNSEFLQNENVEQKQLDGAASARITNFSQADKCIETAISNGHTKASAENCENYSVGCPDCPFK